MSKARNLSLLSTVEAGATTDQTKADIDALGINRGRKNLIINGAMNVKQRADSHSTEGYGSLDRYSIGLSGGSATMSQEDLTLGQSDIPTRFRHYMKLNCTTGNNNCGFYHHIENPSELEGVYTLSFYAKGTNPAAGNFALSVQSSYGTGGSVGVNPHDGTLTVTSSWQRFTVAVTFPSLSGKTINDADGSTAINIRQGGSDTGTAAWALDITGLQIESGSVATDFEHRSYGEELALCQRYYHKSTFALGYTCSSGGSVNSSTIAVIAGMPHPVIMRAAPTGTFSGSTHFAIRHRSVATTCTGVALSADERSTYFEGNVASGLTIGDGCYARSAVNGAWLAFDAEL